MLTFKNNISDFIACDTIRIEDDCHIGIPYEVTLLFDKKNGNIIPGVGGTPIILYVVNTNTERIGQDSDTEIINGMLCRGYAVLVIDYLSNEKACPPALDWSLQKIRRKVMGGDIDGLFTMPHRSYAETFVVPSGYDVSIGLPYWAFDKHGADGSLEKIVDIWNNDFRGTKGDVIIKWTDENGIMKPLTAAFDGSVPVRYNEKHEVCENGEYVQVKHTLAHDISDCAKPDGSHIDLNLYMHITYPRNPKSAVPVLCLSGSSEHLASCAATNDRPQHTGALFRGYAAVIIDYGYTPMARADHYGYFDGYPRKGYVTGDNPTYSMSFYNDKRIFTAGMRFLRYLAMSEPDKYRFDTDAIGIYGNSKGAWMTFLGERNPEKFQSKRMLAGHHDETRFDNGDTEDRDFVRGGEEQPWRFFENSPIKSEADFLYSSCGGLDDAITNGHCPMFISSNRTDSSCYSTSNAMLAACRTHNVPCMWFDIPLPHTLMYGNDLLFNTDSYQGFFDFIGYYLKHDAPKALCARVDLSPCTLSVKLRFTGGIPTDEMGKVSIKDSSGNTLRGKWQGELGGIDWSFTPENLASDTEYILTVPADVTADNGRSLTAPFCYTFRSPRFTCTELFLNGGSFAVTDPENGKNNYLRIEAPQASTHGYIISDECGKELTRLYTNSDGITMISMDKLAYGSLTIKPIHDAINAVKDFTEPESFTVCKKAIASTATAPDGTPAIVIDGFRTVTEHPTEEFYAYPAPAVKFNGVTKDTPTTDGDLCRKFTVKLKIYDTISRYVTLSMSHVTSRINSITDHNRCHMNIVTRPGEWVEASIPYTVYEPIYTDIPADLKSLTVSTYGSGNLKNPLYIADLRVCEELSSSSDITLSLLTDEDGINSLPYGKLDIVCEKSPWQK